MSGYSPIVLSEQVDLVDDQPAWLLGKIFGKIAKLVGNSFDNVCRVGAVDRRDIDQVQQ